MGIAESSRAVGIFVAVHYLGCAVGAVLFSKPSDTLGRKKAIFSCLVTASLGNFIMFIAGFGYTRVALAVLLSGRVVMDLGVGGIDSVIPTYSSEVSKDEARGKALAQEFQSNIFGLLMAFGINPAMTIVLGTWSQWAWRTPIIVMQVYPLLLMALIRELPESPRWFIYHDRQRDAQVALNDIFGNEGDSKFVELLDAHEKEKGVSVGYFDMFKLSHPQFHPTVVVIMCQINQALTGYGAVSVYGPQIFGLLGFPVRTSEYLTLGNYTSYFLLMTGAWLLIDVLGRRKLLVQGSTILSVCFLILTICSGLSMKASKLNIPKIVPGTLGTITLYIATGAFGIGWLATVWLVPTEIFPTTARAQGTIISVIIWGLANFAITFLTPVMFNNLSYFIFLVFAGSNAVAGLWTWLYLPETGGRSFEDNQQFFKDAGEQRTWRVDKVAGGEYGILKYPDPESNDLVDAERVPLLRRVGDQLPSVE